MFVPVYRVLIGSFMIDGENDFGGGDHVDVDAILACFETTESRVHF